MTAWASGPALLTDRYELTMVSAALSTGHADRECVFEVFGRRLPGRRRFGVVAGTGRLLEALRDFSFDEEALSFLRNGNILDDAALDWLAGYRFTGDIDGYPEGECYFPGSPILVVRGTFAEAVVLETLALSILNHDTAIATAAARMRLAAGTRPLVEMGSRRTHEQAAVAAARAAYIAGFTSTSNLEAGRRYGIPTTGTAAHAFTLLHGDERAAFTAQVAALGPSTTLLVDTYDVAEAVRTAVEVAGPKLGAVRIDSGDIGAAARDVRAQLDGLGARDTRILVSGDLDEFAIAGLAAAPVDAYGVGTQVVTGSGAPTAELVYKLVARADNPGVGQTLTGVAKNSAGKPTHKGRKWALRRLSDAGVAEAELLSTRTVPAGDANDRPLLVPMVRGGEVVYDEPLLRARERLTASLAELPRVSLSLAAGDPAIDTTYLEETS
jgi:nicotinate phosphoribosyltransferase